MANDYRILDERDIKNFQAGNKLNVTEIDNKVTYEHIGEPPNKLPLQEQTLEYGGSFDITVPSVYDSTGHVKSETTYSFKMPGETNTSNFVEANNFLSVSPIGVSKSGKNVTYSHNTSGINNVTPTTKEITPDSNNIISLTALSAADTCGHATTNTKYQFTVPSMPSKIELTGGVEGVAYDLNNKKTWTLNTEVSYYQHYIEEVYDVPLTELTKATYTTTSDIHKTHFLYIILTPYPSWCNGDDGQYMIPGQLSFLIPTTLVSTYPKTFPIQVLVKKTQNQNITVTINGESGQAQIEQEKITGILGTVSFQYQPDKEPSKCSLKIVSSHIFQKVDIFGF